MARDILLAGGSAADAATALSFGLAVTLQSSAGLGGGGSCLTYDAGSGLSQALDFMPVASVGRTEKTRWQVATPTLARGLYALHSRYGKLPWAQVVIPAENIVREGVVVSRALANDLEKQSSALANDPRALDVFMSPRRTVVAVGERLSQNGLSTTLSNIRGRTPADFYQGSLAKLIDQNAAEVSTSLSAKDLREYSPRWTDVQPNTIGGYDVYRVEAWGVAKGNGSMWAGEQPRELTQLGSTGFVTADTDGNVVACTLTMVAPFGIGILLPEAGFILAPSPENRNGPVQPMHVQLAVDSGNGRVVFASTTTGSVQRDFPTSLMNNSLSGRLSFSQVFQHGNDQPGTIAEAPSNALYCEDGLYKNLRQCYARNDPSGFGFSIIMLDDG